MGHTAFQDGIPIKQTQNHSPLGGTKTQMKIIGNILVQKDLNKILLL